MFFVIRNYRPEDLPRLQEITVQSFEPVSIDRNIEETFGIIHGHDWKWRKARHIAQDTVRDPKGVFIVEAGGAVIGFITTWMDPEADMGFISNLAIDAAARGQGLGRALIEHACRHFYQHGLRHARIETLEQNPIGRALFPSAGFREVARQIHYCRELENG